jgi:hypothetical protein
MQSANGVESTSGLQENEAVIFGAKGQFKTGEIVSPKLVVPSVAE